MVFLRIVAAILLGCVASGARAELTEVDRAFFLKESYAQYGRSQPDRIDLILYDLAEKVSDLDRLITDFAARLGVDEIQARQYAETIIGATRFREQCSEFRRLKECRFDKDSPLFMSLTTTALLDESGQIATVIGKEVSGYQDPDGHNAVEFLNAIAEHPAYEAILTDLFDFGHDLVWYAALLAQGSQRSDLHQTMLANWHHIHQSTENGNGTLAALYENAVDTARAGEHRQNAISAQQALLKTLLSNGMTREALRIFDELPNDERAEFFIEPKKVKSIELRRRLLYAMYDLGNELVAAQIYETGQASSSARALFQEVRAMEDSWLEQSTQSKVLQDIFDQTYGPNALYDLYLHGVLADGDRPAYLIKFELEEKNRRGTLQGWRFALADSSPHFNWIASARLDDAGVSDIAAQNRADIKIGLSLYSRSTPEGIGAPVPDGYAERKAYWGRMIATSHTNWQNLQNTKTEVTEKASYVVESQLPAAFHSSGGKDGACSPAPLQDMASLPTDLPIASDQVIRYETRGKTRAVVFVSSEFDRPGELPGWGYFVQFDHGKQGWERPIYLGLQMHFPYLLHSVSTHPMLAIDGRLQLEANLAAIDMSSVTFPPLALRLDKERCGVMLDFDLAILTRDSDGDWITDMAEARLGMDPHHPDSDRDGIADGFDSLPLTAFDPTASKENTAIASALLEAMMGIEKHAIMAGADRNQGKLPLPGEGVPPVMDTQFLVADPDTFANIMLPFRLLVYQSGDLAKLGRGDRPFFPPAISAVFTRPNGSERYVIWSAGWTGGTFLVRCDVAGECKMISLREWIT